QADSGVVQTTERRACLVCLAEAGRRRRAEAERRRRMTVAVGRGLAATRVVLQNGAVVISKEARTVPAITMQVSLRAGSIYESDEQIGLSYLTSRMLDRGTERKTSDDIAEALDARGVSLSLNANRHVMT